MRRAPYPNREIFRSIARDCYTIDEHKTEIHKAHVSRAPALADDADTVAERIAAERGRPGYRVSVDLPDLPTFRTNALDGFFEVVKREVPGRAAFL